MRARQTSVQAAVTPSAACISFYGDPAISIPQIRQATTIATFEKENGRQSAETLYYHSSRQHRLRLLTQRFSRSGNAW